MPCQKWRCRVKEINIEPKTIEELLSEIVNELKGIKSELKMLVQGRKHVGI